MVVPLRTIVEGNCKFVDFLSIILRSCRTTSWPVDINNSLGIFKSIPCRERNCYSLDAERQWTLLTGSHSSPKRLRKERHGHDPIRLRLRTFLRLFERSWSFKVGTTID